MKNYLILICCFCCFCCHSQVAEGTVCTIWDKIEMDSITVFIMRDGISHKIYVFKNQYLEVTKSGDRNYISWGEVSNEDSIRLKQKLFLKGDEFWLHSYDRFIHYEKPVVFNRNELTFSMINDHEAECSSKIGYNTHHGFTLVNQQLFYGRMVHLDPTGAEITRNSENTPFVHSAGLILQITPVEHKKENILIIFCGVGSLFVELPIDFKVSVGQILTETDLNALLSNSINKIFLEYNMLVD